MVCTRFVKFFLASLGLILLSHRACIAQAENAAHPPGAEIIRSIKIEIRDIFDKPKEKRFYRWLNGAKINTAEEVIRRELLFKEGDAYDEFRVRESERILRALKYLRRADITPTHDGQFIDLLVSVQDTWTIIPQISYSSGTGKSKFSGGIAEGNAGGLGKRGELLYAEEEGRESIEAVVEDPRVWGGAYRFLGGLFYRSDGTEYVTQFGRPIRSLLDETAWSINNVRSDSAARLFENAEETYIFHQEGIDLSAGYTVALGDPTKLRRRVTFGYSYYENTFTQASSDDYDAFNLEQSEVSSDPALLPENRRFTGPVIAYQAIEPDYVSMNYVDRFDRVVDYNLGRTYNAAVQLAPEFAGSSKDAVLFGTSATDGYRFSGASFIRGELGVDGRYEFNDEGFRQTTLHSELRYYYLFGPLYWRDLYLGKHTFALGLTTDFSHELDTDRQNLLGADNGLRGYEARTFEGDNRVVLNIEQRVHLAEDVLKLISLGAAAFVDVGGATDRSVGNLLNDALYSNVGVGLRLGFPRSSGGRVLRFDVAYPLRDGPDGTEEFEPRFIISGGQVFGATLKSEISRSDETTIGTRFDK